MTLAGWKKAPSDPSNTALPAASPVASLEPSPSDAPGSAGFDLAATLSYLESPAGQAAVSDRDRHLTGATLTAVASTLGVAPVTAPTWNQPAQQPVALPAPQFGVPTAPAVVPAVVPAALPTPAAAPQPAQIPSFSQAQSFPAPQQVPSFSQAQSFPAPQQVHPFQQVPTFVPAPQPGYFPPQYSGAPMIGGYQPPSNGPEFVAGKQGSSAGVIAAAVIGVLLLFCVGLIGAVSLLGSKVQNSFNSISNTLPANGAPYTSPGALGPLTSFEINNGITDTIVMGRNTYGPAAFPTACAVIEPNTGDYSTVACSAGKMNARFVVVGSKGTDGLTTDIEQLCLDTGTSLFATPNQPLTPNDLWMVSYNTGVVECFVVNPSFQVRGDIQPGGQLSGLEPIITLP